MGGADLREKHVKAHVGAHGFFEEAELSPDLIQCRLDFFFTIATITFIAELAFIVFLIFL